MMIELSPKFLDQVIKSVQSSCLSHIEFNCNVQIIGHMYVCVDDTAKDNIIINETVLKDDDESSITFKTDSFTANPQSRPESRRANETSSVRQIYPSDGTVSVHHTEHTQDRVVPSHISPVSSCKNSFSDSSTSPTRFESNASATLTRFDTCSFNSRTNYLSDQSELPSAGHSEVSNKSCEPPEKKIRHSEPREVYHCDSSSQSVVNQLPRKLNEQGQLNEFTASGNQFLNQNQSFEIQQKNTAASNKDSDLKQTIKEEPPDDYSSTSQVTSQSSTENINSGAIRIQGQPIGLIPVSLTSIHSATPQSTNVSGNSVSLSQTTMIAAADHPQPIMYSAATFGHQVIDTTGQGQHQELRVINEDDGVDDDSFDSVPSHLPRSGKVSKKVAQKHNMLELEYGKGIYLSYPQAMKAASKFSGTACATFLLNCFYTNDELLGTNLTGANNKKALDADILSCIISFTLNRFTDADEVGLKKALRNKITSVECKHKRKLLDDSHSDFPTNGSTRYSSSRYHISSRIQS